jgi:hypothetical protein
MPGMVPPSAKPRNALAMKSPVCVLTKEVQREISPKEKTRNGIQNRGPTALRMMLDGISTLSWMSVPENGMMVQKARTQYM